MTASEQQVTVLEPYQRRLPPLRRYFSDLWARRYLLIHLARTTLKAEHMDTTFGRAWFLLNPLMLSCVYFVLVEILGGSENSLQFFPILATGIFFFFYTRTSLTEGARSIVRGSQLVLNVTFPKAVLPGAAVLSGLLALLPALPLVGLMFILVGRPFQLSLLCLPLLIVLLTLFNLGVALLGAVLAVYFRDFSQFVSYINRIWMYLTPILYFHNDIPGRLKVILKFNPLFPIFAALQDSLLGTWPTAKHLLWGSAVALVAFFMGTFAFLSREGNFGTKL